MEVGAFVLQVGAHLLDGLGLRLAERGPGRGLAQVGDDGSGPVGQDGVGVPGDETLGRAVPALVEAPGGFPQVFEHVVKSQTMWVVTPRTRASVVICSSWALAPSSKTIQMRRWPGSRCSAWSKVAEMTV